MQKQHKKQLKHSKNIQKLDLKPEDHKTVRTISFNFLLKVCFFKKKNNIVIPGKLCQARSHYKKCHATRLYRSTLKNTFG